MLQPRLEDAPLAVASTAKVTVRQGDQAFDPAARACTCTLAPGVPRSVAEVALVPVSQAFGAPGDGRPAGETPRVRVRTS